MERDYTTAHYEEIIRKIREKIPTCTIATDIIVGFPGETKDEFAELLTFAKRMKFDFSYTAIFSPRKNNAVFLEKQTPSSPTATKSPSFTP